MAASASSGTIRQARAGEAALLTDLTWRALAHWDYDAAFMDWCREGVRVRPEYLHQELPYVLDEAGGVTGFYILRRAAPEMDLHFLMVEPRLIGTGRGKQLVRHAAETARAHGATVLTIDSDPNAEPFYRAMGAVRVGLRPQHPPHMPDWQIRVMRLALSPLGG